MSGAAVATPTAQGHRVQVGDLCAMGFRAIPDAVRRGWAQRMSVGRSGPSKGKRRRKSSAASSSVQKLTPSCPET